MNFQHMVRALHKHGFTYKEIGKEIGRSESGVSEVVHGRTKNPRGGAAIKLHTMYHRYIESAKPAKKKTCRK